MLVTNEPDRSAWELVAMDKGQEQVEQAFRWAKSHWRLDAFCLHNPLHVTVGIFAHLYRPVCAVDATHGPRRVLQDHPPRVSPLLFLLYLGGIVVPFPPPNKHDTCGLCLIGLGST